MKLLEVQSTKDFASTFLNDIFFKMAVNRVLDAAPAFDLVHCKECKHWCYEYDDVGLCVTDVPDIDGVQRLADDFCSYGERKDE